MKTKVVYLRQYVEAVKEYQLEEKYINKCLSAELYKVEGNVVYFRNYKVEDLEYIEFCFIRVENKVIFNYMFLCNSST